MQQENCKFEFDKTDFFSVSEYKLFEGDKKLPNPHLSTIIYSLINQ